MNTQNLFLSIIVFGTVVGCSKPDAAPPAAASSTVASATPTKAASAPTKPGPATGNPVTQDVVDAIKIPAPAKGPPGAKWKWIPHFDSTLVNQSGNFLDSAGKQVMSFQIADCRSPYVIAGAASQKDSPGGDFEPCYTPGPDALKGYALHKPYPNNRLLRVGNFALSASCNGAYEKTMNGDDMDAFLLSLDLAAIAKL